MTSSAISGRSGPSISRAGVVRASVPSSIRLTTASAVSPLLPLAIANRVATVLAMPCARSARPYATASTVSPLRSTRTTPENPDDRASSSIASARGSMAGTLP